MLLLQGFATPDSLVAGTGGEITSTSLTMVTVADITSTVAVVGDSHNNILLVMLKIKDYH